MSKTEKVIMTMFLTFICTTTFLIFLEISKPPIPPPEPVKEEMLSEFINRIRTYPNVYDVAIPKSVHTQLYLIGTVKRIYPTKGYREIFEKKNEGKLFVTDIFLDILPEQFGKVSNTIGNRLFPEFDFKSEYYLYDLQSPREYIRVFSKSSPEMIDEGKLVIVKGNIRSEAETYLDSLRKVCTKNNKVLNKIRKFVNEPTITDNPDLYNGPPIFLENTSGRYDVEYLFNYKQPILFNNQ